MTEVAEAKKEIYTYDAGFRIYAMNWSVRHDRPFRIALSSFSEAQDNKVRVVQLNDDKGCFEVLSEVDHPYPATNLKWIPDKLGSRPDMFATTADYLRIWRVSDDGKSSLRSTLHSNKTSEFCAPLTSFDWNENNPDLIGTSSIDTTCTIWNVSREQPVTQLIAHDKEVFDIAFATASGNADIFASVGADGSVRMFDLRNLEHSTIIYETQDEKPLLRLAWNKQDPNYLATFQMDDMKVIILDIRLPSVPAAELTGHTACLNSLAWAPHSSNHICTAADDKHTLIWDISRKPVTDPVLSYAAEEEVNTLQWSLAQPDWISIAYNSKMQILRV